MKNSAQHSIQQNMKGNFKKKLKGKPEQSADVFNDMNNSISLRFDAFDFVLETSDIQCTQNTMVSISNTQKGA